MQYCYCNFIAQNFVIFAFHKFDMFVESNICIKKYYKFDDISSSVILDVYHYDIFIKHTMNNENTEAYTIMDVYM